MAALVKKGVGNRANDFLGSHWTGKVAFGGLGVKLTDALLIHCEVSRFFSRGGSFLEDSQRQNPYAPPIGDVGLRPPEADLADSSPTEKRRSWLGSLMVWGLVCSVSAIPSFVWGLGTVASMQALAMLLGVLIFIVGYVFADQLTQQSSWRRNKSLRLALRIGYITRLVISIIFPVGGTLDMFCGLLSISIIDSVWGLTIGGGSRLGAGMGSFGQVLATTLVQGVVLNVVLSAFVLLVFGITLVAKRGAK